MSTYEVTADPTEATEATAEKTLPDEGDLSMLMKLKLVAPLTFHDKFI